MQPYDWVSAMADWWDTHLRHGAPRPEPDPPVLFFSSGGGWRAARQWPPDGVSSRHFFLAGHRLEAAAAPPARRDYHADPLVGLAAGIWDPFGTGHGWPEEQSSDDARSLTFTSDPLPEPLLVAGAPRPTCPGPAAGHRAEPRRARLRGRPRRAVHARHHRLAPRPARRRRMPSPPG